MAYNVFINPSEEALNKLGFPLEKIKYVYNTSNDVVKTDYLYQTDNETFNKMINKFKGGDYDIQEKDKLYILPGVGIPKYKIKEYAKSMKATVTTDITKATVIIGTEDLNIFDTRYSQPTSSTLFISNLDAYDIQETTTEINFIDGSSIKEAIFSRDAYRGNLDDILEPYDEDLRIVLNNQEYLVFPLVISLIYEMLSKKLPVLNEMDLHKKFASSVKLSDQSTFEGLYSTLNSGDPDSVELGVELLCNCNIEGANYEIWKLARDFGSMIPNNNRSANLRFFINNSEYYTYYGLNTIESMFEYFYDNKMLTKEIIEKEVEDYYNVVNERVQNQTNTFDVSITLKEKYQDILDEKFSFFEEEEEVIEEEVIDGEIAEV